jgi:hypothetical protein
MTGERFRKEAVDLARVKNEYCSNIDNEGILI